MNTATLEHPAPTAANMTIEIKPFKRGEWDRCYKEVLINGERWGYVETKWHGCHGTSFELSDLHSAVTRPMEGARRPDARPVPVTCRQDKTMRSHRIGNIGRPESEQETRLTTNALITNMIRDAIAKGWLRSPAARQKEIDDARDRYSQSCRAHEAAVENELSEKAIAVLTRLSSIGGVAAEQSEDGTYPQKYVDVIVAAMKWAQSK